jgi:hypothetical protein
MRAIDIAGQRYGMLVVLERAGNNGSGKSIWTCRCDCGRISTPTSNNLRSGAARSCGCQVVEAVIERNQKHGLSGTGAYSSWKAMKKRCLNPDDSNYADYGGRGITVCVRWIESFDNFFHDMGPRPPGRSVERINVNGNYEPDNCYWATAKQQRANQRRNQKAA